MQHYLGMLDLHRLEIEVKMFSRGLYLLLSLMIISTACTTEQSKELSLPKGPALLMFYTEG